MSGIVVGCPCVYMRACVRDSVKGQGLLLSGRLFLVVEVMDKRVTEVIETEINKAGPSSEMQELYVRANAGVLTDELTAVALKQNPNYIYYWGAQ